MTGMDFLAFASAATSCVCLGLRANMLKPKFATWRTARDAVWLSLAALSVVMLIVAVSILRGASASWREALVCAVLAWASVALLWNLWEQKSPQGQAIDRAVKA